MWFRLQLVPGKAEVSYNGLAGPASEGLKRERIPFAHRKLEKMKGKPASQRNVYHCNKLYSC